MFRQTTLSKLWVAFSGGSRRQKRRISSIDSIVGKTGVAHTIIDDTGTVLIEGELWRARSTSVIEPGIPIAVVGTNAAFLDVKPVP